MKNLTKLAAATFVVAALAQTNAGAVTVSATSTALNVGATGSFDILVAFNPGEAIDSGGVDIAWDPAIFRIDSIVVNDVVWDFFTTPGTTDNLAGTATGIDGISFSDVTTDFIHATVNITALATGSTGLTLSEAGNNPFSHFGNLVAVGFVPGSVAVVPEPAAAWMFLSGLGLLGYAARRKFSV
jgi:hypothetical protein